MVTQCAGGEITLTYNLFNMRMTILFKILFKKCQLFLQSMYSIKDNNYCENQLLRTRKGNEVCETALTTVFM